LKGKVFKWDVLCLLDTRASHNFITQESAEKMEPQLEELKAPIEVHFAKTHHMASERCASSTKELKRKGGFVGFHLRGDKLHFGN
jgi:hypothetical protein